MAFDKCFQSESMEQMVEGRQIQITWNEQDRYVRGTDKLAEEEESYLTDKRLRNGADGHCPVTLTLDRVNVISACTIHTDEVTLASSNMETWPFLSPVILTFCKV